MRYEYDVFISYAIEDKIDIVNDLVLKLEQTGAKVWYTGWQLRVDQKGKCIKDGLEKSQIGIIVLSENYLKKNWPRKELREILCEGKYQKYRIVPIWHNITGEELERCDPLFACKKGLSTSEGIESIINQINQLINKQSVGRKERTWWPLIIIVILLMSFLRFTFFTDQQPTERLIHATITQRIQKLNNQVQQYTPKELLAKGNIAHQEIIGGYDKFRGLKTQIHREFEFYNGFQTVNHPQKINEILQLEVEALTPFNYYGLDHPEVQLIEKRDSLEDLERRYAYFNRMPVNFNVEEIKIQDDQCHVKVSYENNIRYLMVNLHSFRSPEWVKRSCLLIKGLMREETFIFSRENKKWRFSGIGTFTQ